MAAHLSLASAVLFASACAVDWSTKGVVLPVHDGGFCGSSATLAVFDAVQSALGIKSGHLVELSLQQLRDCAGPTDPCSGGDQSQPVMTYVTKMGLCSAADYPSVGKKGACHDSLCSPALPLGTQWHTVKADSEDALTAALEQQPVVVVVNAAPLENYTGGVFSGTCDASALDHTMLLVGDGSDSSGTSFWKVKNDWGVHWGLNGFALVARGRGGAGQCGILARPFYPQLPNVAATLAPQAVDWSTKGVLPPVREQGVCGSSATLAVLDSLSSAFAIAGNSVDLSLQQLRDCAGPGDPCASEQPQEVLDYVTKKGLCSETDYPMARNGKCQDAACRPSLRPGTQWKIVPPNENALAEALARQPVVVALNAAPLEEYRSGIFSGKCDPSGIDHMMLLVGEGADGSGTQFWKVRNDWGTNWGMNGFGLLSRGGTGSSGPGQCGIQSQAFYPQLADQSVSIQV